LADQGFVAVLPDYDPSIIERAAERLYEKATAALIGSVVVGACLGAGFGSVPLTSLGENWPIPASFGFATMLAGSIIGAVVGYVIGDARAFGYRLQAQATLSQLQLVRNTAMASEALQALAAARGPVPAPKPKPAAQAPAPRPAAPAAPSAPPAVRPPVNQPPLTPPPSVAPPAAATQR
jgi:hypothetical protein